MMIRMIMLLMLLILLLINNVISLKISMMSHKRSNNVVIIGSTGKLGYQITQQLLAYNTTSNDNIYNDDTQLVITTTARDLGKARLLYGPDTSYIKCIPLDIAKDSTNRMKSIIDNADAVIIASGAIGLKESYNVDNIGNKKIIDACIQSNVRKIILVTSLLTSGIESGQFLNPQFILLNLFGGLLLNKRQAEMYLESKKDQIDYTIIRPGGLSNNINTNDNTSLRISKENSFFTGQVSRAQIASVVVAALTCKNDEAKNKIFEVISSKEQSKATILEAFRNVEASKSKIT